MASKKTYTIIFIAVAIIVVVAVLLYVFRCKLFNLNSCVKDPNKEKEPVPHGSPTTTWIPEIFPLNLGMFGPKIKALQKKLVLPKYGADGKFGNETKDALIAKGSPVPLPEPDYNTLMGIVIPSEQIGKNVYAKWNDVKVFNSDFSVYKITKKDEYVGTITGINKNYPAFYNLSADRKVTIVAVYVG